MILQATPGTVHLYDQALRQGELKRARVRLQNCLVAYYGTLGGDALTYQDCLNLAVQGQDVIDELYQGYPNKKGTNNE